MDKVDAVVIGAGVVGLAVGRALATRGLETIVLERADAIGTVTSSRNGEVIHAGIYYPTGSLKARLCVAGRKQLYGYLASHGVAHRRCGKLIVATSAEQSAKLSQIEAQASPDVSPVAPIAAAGVGEAARWCLWAAREVLDELWGCLQAHRPLTPVVCQRAGDSTG